jgi:hypothetical protein
VHFPLSTDERLAEGLWLQGWWLSEWLQRLCYRRPCMVVIKMFQITANTVRIMYSPFTFYVKMHSWRSCIIQDKFSHRSNTYLNFVKVFGISFILNSALN